MTILPSFERRCAVLLCPVLRYTPHCPWHLRPRRANWEGSKTSAGLRPPATRETSPCTPLFTPRTYLTHPLVLEELGRWWWCIVLEIPSPRTCLTRAERLRRSTPSTKTSTLETPNKSDAWQRLQALAVETRWPHGRRSVGARPAGETYETKRKSPGDDPSFARGKGDRCHASCHGTIRTETSLVQRSLLLMGIGRRWP